MLYPPSTRTFRRSCIERFTWYSTERTVCVLPCSYFATSQAIHRPVNCSRVSVNQTWDVSRNRRSNWNTGIQPDRSSRSLELVTQMTPFRSTCSTKSRYTERPFPLLHLPTALACHVAGLSSIQPDDASGRETGFRGLVGFPRFSSQMLGYCLKIQPQPVPSTSLAIQCP
jgi:hypothetical protein